MTSGSDIRLASRPQNVRNSLIPQGTFRGGCVYRVYPGVEISGKVCEWYHPSPLRYAVVDSGLAGPSPMPLRIQFSSAPKVRAIPAQGNALGRIVFAIQSPEGATQKRFDALARPFRAWKIWDAGTQGDALGWYGSGLWPWRKAICSATNP